MLSQSSGTDGSWSQIKRLHRKLMFHWIPTNRLAKEHYDADALKTILGTQSKNNLQYGNPELKTPLCHKPIIIGDFAVDPTCIRQ